MDVTTNHGATLTFLSVLDISPMLQTQPPELPDCGLEARNTSQKCSQLDIFLQAGNICMYIYIYLVGVCHKQKIPWGSPNARWSLFVCVSTNPSAQLNRLHPPPFEPGFSRVSANLWWKPEGKHTNCPSNERIQAEGQPLWPEFRVTRKNHTNWTFRWTLDV